MECQSISRATKHGHSPSAWGEVTDDAGQTVTARLSGPEAYVFTARTAIAVLKRALAGDTNAGFQTPGQMYGPDFVLEIDGVVREDIG